LKLVLLLPSSMSKGIRGFARFLLLVLLQSGSTSLCHIVRRVVFLLALVLDLVLRQLYLLVPFTI